MPTVSVRMRRIFTSSTFEETISSFMTSSLAIVQYELLPPIHYKSAHPFFSTSTSASTMILTFTCSSICFFYEKWSSSSLILMKSCCLPIKKINFDLKSLLQWLLAILVYSLFMHFKRSHQFMNWKSWQIFYFFNNNNYMFKFLWSNTHVHQCVFDCHWYYNFSGSIYIRKHC